MSRAVRNVGNKVLTRTLRIAQQTVYRLDDNFDQVDILPLVEAPDIVGIGHTPLMEYEVDGARVILHIEPVAHVLALAVNGQRTTVADVVYEERDQLLGELVGPVVVRAVGHDRRHAVRVVERTHKVIRRGLRCRIGRMGIILRILVEEVAAVGKVMLARRGRCRERRLDALGIGQFQSPVDLIRRDVVEELAVPRSVPILARRLQQRQRTQHVRARKGEGILDRAVNVALGRKVDNAVDRVLAHDLPHAVEITDVGPFEDVVRTILHILQIGQIARVCQLVEVDDTVIGILVYEEAHDMAPDKARTARDQYIAFHCCSAFFNLPIQYSIDSRQWGISRPKVCLILLLSRTE